MNVVKDLSDKGLIKPPKWLADNICYLTTMGSIAYGVSDDTSDLDVYGFCIPPKDYIFPHLAGYIEGFGNQKQSFEQYQQHHIDAGDGKRTYDFSVYNIVKYFQLCAENNPNMIDSMYTPQFCVLSTTKIGNIIRDNRDSFLHKGCYHKFRGYAFSMLHKADVKVNCKEIKSVYKFEDDHGLSRQTIFEEVENEMKRRKFI
jgi:predicted nucleotidyltransferase